MNNRTAILVCCHKQDDYAKKDPFLPIQVGKAVSTVDLGIQGMIREIILVGKIGIIVN